MLASIDLPFRTITNTFRCTSSAKELTVHRRLPSAARKFASIMSVQEYIDKHDLSKKVEEVINACVKAKPDEPISFMVHLCDTSFSNEMLSKQILSELPFNVCCDELAGREAEAFVSPRNYQGCWQADLRLSWEPNGGVRRIHSQRILQSSRAIRRFNWQSRGR